MYKGFESGELINVAKRQIIDTTDKVFYIKEGIVGVYVGLGKNRRKLISMIHGNTFPLDLAYKSPLWQSDIHYIAFTDTLLYVLPREKFMHEQKSMDKKELLDKLEEAKQRNTWLMERIINLLTYDVGKRLYLRLILLAEYLGTKDNGKIILNIPITYVDIAESIGTTRETINRLITSLQKDGIVSIEKRIITIESLSKLKKLYESEGKKTA